MTKQIKTYYAQGPYISETKDNLLFTDKAVEVILKSDHDEIVKKLVEALEFECGNRCAEQNPCNAKEALKEIGEL